MATTPPLASIDTANAAPSAGPAPAPAPEPVVAPRTAPHTAPPTAPDTAPRPAPDASVDSVRPTQPQTTATGLRIGRFRVSAWWLAVLGTGIGAGLVGIGLTLLLHLVQHVAFGYTESTFLYGVMHASPARRVLVLVIGGAVAGGGWWLLRRLTTVRTVDEAISAKATALPMLATAADSCLQVIVVGLGASLGREGAPRQLAGAVGAWLAERLQLTPEDRRIIIAAGAGAGLAAVYNVPLGGCLFAVEVLLRSLAPRAVISAALASAIATAVSWLVLPNQPTYHLPGLPLTGSLLVWSVLLGPVAGLAGWAFHRLTSWARATLPTSWRLPVATIVAFAALGALAIPFPALLGNGKGPTQLALAGSLTIGLAAALFVLKPLVTALCLRSGATGGLLTPSLATGALLGAAAGLAWSLLWPGGSLGAFALVGAAAMLAVTQRAPLCAIVLALEFTDASPTILVPMVLAVAGAMITGRGLRRERAVSPVSAGPPTGGA